MARLTVADLQRKKERHERIVMLTAYDYPLAALVDACGADIVLVGDSVANVVLGLKDTREVGMAEMLHHAKAVDRAVAHAMVVGDMPYAAGQAGPAQAVENAKRFVGEAGCGAVKLEWFDGCAEVAEAVAKAGVPVMGHIGLTPQTAEKLGGFKVQGREAEAAARIIRQADLFQEKGAFALVLECIPDRVAQMVTERLSIPTIGIGAGPGCDGQVLVTHDLLGLFDRFRPKFARRYADAGAVIREGLERFCRDVRAGSFPDAGHSFHISDDEFEKLKQEGQRSL